jgi:hypothetical protein
MADDVQIDNADSARTRTLTCGVLYSTVGAVADVEDWLDDNCKSDWSLVVEGMDDDLIKKSLRIMFEVDSDKVKFINDFARA